MKCEKCKKEIKENKTLSQKVYQFDDWTDVPSGKNYFYAEEDIKELLYQIRQNLPKEFELKELKKLNKIMQELTGERFK